MSWLTNKLALNSEPMTTATFGGLVGGTALSGVPVSPETALKLSTVWGCTRLLSETTASLPAVVYQRVGESGRRRATQNPLYDVLHDEPNAHQTAFDFFDYMTHVAIMRGNAVARKKDGPRGPVDQLVPIPPDYVTIEKLSDNSLRFLIHEPYAAQPEILLEDEVLHLRGYTLDGLIGQSVVSYARDSFGLGLGAERFGSRYFANAAAPSGVLESTKEMSDVARKRLKGQFEAATTGPNAHGTPVLEDGVTWKQVGLTNKDSQFLESREFQAEEVCRWFRVPPHMVGLTSKATSWGSGIEQMSLGFVTYTLMPWLTRWEQAITRACILAPQLYFVEFLLDALLRGDTKARYDAYAVAKQNGWMSGNEIRARENQNPMPRGDRYWMPANYIEIGSPPPVVAPAPVAPSGHYDQLLHEAAARIVRKERAMRKRADVSVGEDHAAFVSEALVVPLSAAQSYLDWRNDHRAEEFDPDAIERLVGIAIGEP